VHMFPIGGRAKDATDRGHTVSPHPDGVEREYRVRPTAHGIDAAASAIALVGLLSPVAAHASFLPPELMGQAATYVAWFVIVCMPIAAIVLFWMVHVLPEKIAHKRHHPQTDAIKTLCLLSLAFGGLLWPLAWLWAYTKPVMYRLAYGTDRVEYHGPPGTATAEPAEDRRDNKADEGRPG